MSGRPLRPSGGRTPTATVPLAIGLSSVCAGSRASPRASRRPGRRSSGRPCSSARESVVAFEELGAYKYLLGSPPTAASATRRSSRHAHRRVRPRSWGVASPTLAEFLERRGSIAATSDALHIHANTLRQRLRRIGDLSGIDLRRDDWLMVEIAVKLVQLRLVLAATIGPFRHIEGLSRWRLWPSTGRAGVIGTPDRTRRELRWAPTRPSSRRSAKTIAERGIEFIFAQFVDMYGRPSAKLIPAAQLDALVEDGAGLRGLRGRRDRAASERSRHRGDSRPRQLHARAVAAEPGAVRLRRDGRGGGVAVLPTHDPAERPRAGGDPGLRVQDRDRARVLPRAAQRRRHDRDRGQARHAREAVLRHGGADAAVRLPDHGLAVLQRARLGQLRERPRGCERPVRAELRVRRRARQLRSRDLLPLHGAHARRAVRQDRDLHAEAVHDAHRQRLPLPHVALEGRHERVPRRVGSAWARALGAGLQLHRRAEGARSGVQRADGADRQLVQAAEARLDRRAAPPGRRSGSRTATTTAPRC